MLHKIVHVFFFFCSTVSTVSGMHARLRLISASKAWSIFTAVFADATNNKQTHA